MAVLREAVTHSAAAEAVPRGMALQVRPAAAERAGVQAQQPAQHMTVTPQSQSNSSMILCLQHLSAP